MATKKTGPGSGIMKYAPKVTTTTKKTTSASSGKKTTTTSTGGGKKTTSYVGKPTTSNTVGKKTTTAAPSTGSNTTTNKPMQKSTDPNRYFVGERRGTSPTQEVSYGEYQKARTNPNLATVKINKADTAKINNLSRSYGASEIKGFVKKKVK